MSIIDQARKYLDAIPSAVSGNGGHNQTFSVAMSLVEGFALSAGDARPLLAEYAARCDPPWSDREIDHKLADAEKHVDPAKRGKLISRGVKFQSQARAPREVTLQQPVTPKPVPKTRAVVYDVPDSVELPTPIPDSTLKFIESVFQSGDGISISKGRFNDEQKEVPSDGGYVDARDKWAARIRKAGGDINKILKSSDRNGIFVRINSVRDGRGTDDDVLSFRYALLESDKISLQEQWSIIVQSGIPCAAVILSGGKSIHAWIKVYAKDRQEYNERVKIIYEHFGEQFKPDEKNKNPSRFSRLPGCERGSSRQELLALNIGCENFEEWLESIPTDLQLKLAERRFDYRNPPPELVPIYSLCGIPVCTAGNLTSIVSQAKTGKSAVIGSMMASTFAGSGCDLLGFDSQNDACKAIVHFDTEQSPYDSWHVINRAVLRAKATEPPAWLFSYCLTGFLPREAWEAVKESVRMAAKQFGGIHSILIDGVGDLVHDVNDAGECTDFVAELHGLAITYQCPIVGVLHFNPESAKARGHLGSQLERKSESNLRLDKEDDGATILWSNKQRRSSIQKDIGPRFTWNNDLGMHVTIESNGEARTNAKAEKEKPLRDELFGDRPSMRWSEINKAIIALGKSDSTASRTLAKWKALDIIEPGGAGLWVKKG